MSETNAQLAARKAREMEERAALLAQLNRQFKKGRFVKRALFEQDRERFQNMDDNLFHVAVGRSCSTANDFIEICNCYIRTSAEGMFTFVTTAKSTATESLKELKESIALGLENRDTLTRNLFKPSVTVLEDIQNLIDAINSVYRILQAQEDTHERNVGAYQAIKPRVVQAATRMRIYLE